MECEGLSTSKPPHLLYEFQRLMERENRRFFDYCSCQSQLLNCGKKVRSHCWLNTCVIEHLDVHTEPKPCYWKACSLEGQPSSIAQQKVIDRNSVANAVSDRPQ